MRERVASIPPRPPEPVSRRPPPIAMRSGPLEAATPFMSRRREPPLSADQVASIADMRALIVEDRWPGMRSSTITIVMVFEDHRNRRRIDLRFYCSLTNPDVSGRGEHP